MCRLSMKLSNMFDPNHIHTFGKTVVNHIPMPCEKKLAGICMVTGVQLIIFQCPLKKLSRDLHGNWCATNVPNKL